MDVVRSAIAAMRLPFVHNASERNPIIRSTLAWIVAVAVLGCAASRENPSELGGAGGQSSAGSSSEGGRAAAGASSSGGARQSRGTGGAGVTGGSGGSVGSGGSKASGGSTASGGSVGTGGGTGSGGELGSGGRATGPCDNLPAAGTWEDITPTTARGIDGTVYNTQAFMLDPFDSRTVWLGTARPNQAMPDQRSGLYRSTDCGATWTHVNTGQGGASLDGSALWSMAIDPVDKGVMYSVAAYGAGGLFKSTDGGVSWTQLFTQGTEIAQHFQYNSIGAVIMDPTDHAHLVITSHGSCSAPYGSNGSACQAETLDSGATWTIVPNPDGLGFQENAGAYLIGRDNWIYASPWAKTYRTTDHGKSWSAVGPGAEAGESAHHPLVAASDGNYYLPSDSGVLRSRDNGASWSLLPNTPGGYGFATGGGHLYTCPEFNLAYRTAALSDVTKWTSLPNPPSRATGRGSAFMDYDENHHLLFSSNFEGGLFRMVTP